jgi:chromosome segregation ATPase
MLSFFFNREVAEAELVEISSLMRTMETDALSHKVNADSLEKKCARLRDYIRKLTTKCEEWEQSYDRQARTVEKLQEKNARIRDKASDIANRYRKLAGDAKHSAKKHHENRIKWTEERSNLREVHMTLEQELELITKELSIPLDSAFEHGVVR